MINVQRMDKTMTTLAELNSCDATAFAERLHGIYEHSPWIPLRAAAQRPYASLATLKQALQAQVSNATQDEQLGLIRAHPELAGKAAIAGELTAESTSEQARSGLNQCSPEEFATLQQLNADYNAKFGFPFILAVKGPTGNGLTRQQIIATFTRRLKNQRGDEQQECLRQIHRIAEMRLNVLLDVKLPFGPAIMQWAEELAQWSDDADGLTCAYMTSAHQQSAARLAEWMRAAGMEVHIDDVGNVVGRYRSGAANAKTLMTGSHYDTVRNGGKYDGRLGILLPIAIVQHLHAAGEKLPFDFEIVGFAEEEGVRFRSTFLGSNAITGRFDMGLLDQLDADGVSMRTALTDAGRDVAAIPGIARDPATLLGYVEVHIEQGPVLLQRGLPLGVVTAIAGSSRFLIELRGLASHAGTTPMGQRRDAAAGVAELILFAEARAASVPDVVATIGMLEVPSGSINVIPGRCRFSLDLRATTDTARDAVDADVRAKLDEICQRRGLSFTLQPTLAANAAPSDATWQSRWEAAVTELGLPLHRLPSGAGHDAMKLHEVMPQAMLFVRGQNSGISHNPLESTTSDDIDLAIQALTHLLTHLSPEQQ